VSITSIATYLPSSTEHDDAAFAGTTFHQPLAPSLTPIQEASLRIQQAEKQSRDADERNVAWSGEDAVQLSNLDCEGEYDPEYVRLPDGTYEKVKFRDPGMDNMAPVGLRNGNGTIEPMSQIDSEAHFGGVSEPVPTRLQELVRICGTHSVISFLNRCCRMPLK
jgi:meiosis-specific protein